MPKLTVPAPHVPVDEAELHAMQVLEGVRCGGCDTLREGSGCECERYRAFYRELLGVVLWADKSITALSSDPRRVGKAAVGLVTGAAWRASRRYGVTLPADFGARIKARYGVDPRYTAPRVVEQSYLPV